MIKIKRIYEPHTRTDGYRILIDRLWPRGIKKEDAHLDKWLRDVAPSSSLRKWFNHDAAKWDNFVERYTAELHNSSALAELKDDIAQHKTVTLLYAAKDETHNNAVVLLTLLQHKK
ncbi:MAG: DUF488 domain-containing protein [Flavipsychrobacter sp.]